MSGSFWPSLLTAVRDYWFLITLFMSAAISIAYMIIFRVNPWDAQRSVKLRREQVRFHNSVGQVLLEEGRFKAAKNEFDEALKLVPEDRAALGGRSLSDLFIGLNALDWDAAVALAIQRHLTARTADERDRFAHVVQKYLGDLFSRIGDSEQRDIHYKEALKLKPAYPDALFAVGWNFYTEQTDPDRMEAAFRQIAKNNPHDYRGLHGLGYALYIKAIREKDQARRSALIADATKQSEKAGNLSINALLIVMDFGEVARSGNPDVSLYFHKQARKIVDDPKLNQLGDNPSNFLARLLMSDDSVDIGTPNQKSAWIEYQIALDYLAMHRRGIGNDGATQHDAAFAKAKRLDPDGLMLKIYRDQLAILDLLLPEK